jgi:hypothetical protein
MTLMRKTNIDSLHNYGGIAEYIAENECNSRRIADFTHRLTD